MPTVLVCEARVPFVRGGAELLVAGLIDQLRRHGCVAETASVPFKWYPKEELPAQAAAWRMIDLSESNGRTIDVVIATKFPTYFVRHPNKVTWLFHQYRAIYDLMGTPYSEFTHSEQDVRLRDRLVALDTDVLAESHRLLGISKNVVGRLARFNGLQAEAVYHPPPLAGRLRRGEPGDYVLSVGRLEANKRVDLIIRALAYAGPPVRLIVAGEGPLAASLAAVAEEAGVSGRVTFAGDVSPEELIRLYEGALAVVFPPYDEDYGYVTLEAFLSGKPVITTHDAGGPLEFVTDAVTGLVADPDPEAIGAAIARVAGDRGLTRRLGDCGYERVRGITWDGVVERLLR